MEAHADFLSGELRRNWPPLLCVTGHNPREETKGVGGLGRGGGRRAISYLMCENES